MEERSFNKVLVANRGEIAIRVFRACYDLGLHTVAIYSNDDTFSLFRTKADEAYLIGENTSPLKAYLDIPSIINLAKQRKVDAIHPGYGFLSENPDFARACEDAGITFIGPNSSVLAKMGDKLTAKAIAYECGVKTIPGSKVPLVDSDDALKKAEEYGFPVILKAAGGGGGRGMRRCDNADEIKINFELVKNEARKAFGNDDIFIEKFLVDPKHIEVQILGDKYGNVVHLHERDCSLQRRYQKVVEFAPAFTVPESVRDELYADAVKIAKHIGYENAGTVEFLVDKDFNHYFIEMNPRIQVEHTVTEMVTGIDLVRAQILIAEGRPLSDPEIGITDQESVRVNGYAIQCRVTTEDPSNNFAPDTGKITSYRSGGGFGVRLDGGVAYTGAVISPYYDSLLVKVTAFDNTFEAVCRKAIRALSEEHIRGVKTNIPFLTNILSHPTFRAGNCHTKFIDNTPELFEISSTRDRATKVLRYIAQLQVDKGDAEHKIFDPIRIPNVENNPPKAGLKQLLDEKGPDGLKDWVLNQKKLLISDTTMRDAHQSLLSTRMRTIDMLGAAEGAADILSDCFSLEMWGGATFDVAYRFLHESPWERLRLLREKIPNIPFQMLLRGSNAVGYANYPDNLVAAFIREACVGGIDIFRVFDSLNWIDGMTVAMEEVLKQNKVLEAAMCYTGNISDPKRDKFTLDYYVKMAKELERRGAHIIAIKDMAGLLKPYDAKKLISTLKNEVGVPIRFHTHDTSGNQVASYLMAAEAGVDIVDCAVESMSSMISQPSMNAVVSALSGQERDTGLDINRLSELSDYWSDVRQRYSSFETGIKSPSADIYRYEMPGGQYSNLKSQVESLGMGTRFDKVRDNYMKVNDMLGDIVKVTPSSKMVGDFAIFMEQNGLTPENILEKGKELTFPDSVVSYFKGLMGQPPQGFPVELQKIVLKGEKPIEGRAGAIVPPIDFEEAEKSVKSFYPNASSHNVISWCLYPKVVEDFYRHRLEYGYIMGMGSDIFFNGMNIGETARINIEDGKTLIIKYKGLGDLNEDGTRNVHFELNGMGRDVAVPDKAAKSLAHNIPMAEPNDKRQVGATIPGMVSKLNVAVGDKVREGDVLCIVEAMKMETGVSARCEGIVEDILISEGSVVSAGELLILLK